MSNKHEKAKLKKGSVFLCEDPRPISPLHAVEILHVFFCFVLILFEKKVFQERNYQSSFS